MRMRMVGFGLVALACVSVTACSSSAKPSGTGTATTTTTPTTTPVTLPGSAAGGPTVPPPAGKADPCEALTVGNFDDAFGAGAGDGVRGATQPGWCTWTISGGAQVTFQYPGSGAKYNDKTPNAVQVASTQRSTAGNTKDVPGVGDAAYFVVIDSTLVVAKAPDTLFSLHYEAGVPTDDAVLLPKLSAVARAFLGQPPA